MSRVEYLELENHRLDRLVAEVEQCSDARVNAALAAFEGQDDEQRRWAQQVLMKALFNARA